MLLSLVPLHKRFFFLFSRFERNKVAGGCFREAFVTQEHTNLFEIFLSGPF